MQNRYGKRIFVTGASSGIGKSVAEAFAREGCQVIGVSRRCEEGTRTLGTGSLTMMRMDVTNEDSIRKGIAKIREEMGGIDIAILAAGMGIAGAAEEMPMDLARQQMEVNYFGVLGVCHQVLPLMREQGKGLLLVVSSIAGRIPIPMQCHYSSSKYALEAYVEAVRMEMRDYGVRACLIEPGDTKTGFTKERNTYNPEGSPYHEVCEKSVAKMAADEQGGKSPESVADVALRLAGRKEPPVRVAVGAVYKAILILERILPDKALEGILRKMYLPV